MVIEDKNISLGNNDKTKTLEPTTSAYLIRGVFQYLVDQGIDAKKIEKAGGLKWERLDDIEGRIPFSERIRFWEAAYTLTENPALGLHVGNALNFSDFGILGLIGRYMSNIYDLFAGTLPIEKLLHEHTKWDFDRDDNFTYWTLSFTDEKYATIFEVEASFATGIRLMQQKGMQKIIPVEAHFAYDAPTYIDEYKEIFSCPLYFSQNENRLILKNEDIGRASTRYTDYISSVAVDHAEKLFEALPFFNLTQKKVKTLIAQNMELGDVSIENIANLMNTSKKTLYRRLKDEGVVFNDLVDKTRKEHAAHYLKNTKLSIKSISNKLGYSDTPNFNRAFKRWFAISPQAYRNEHRR